MTKYNHYGDLEIVGNPKHTHSAILVTETFDFTTKLYTFPDMISRYRFVKMLESSKDILVNLKQLVD